MRTGYYELVIIWSTGEKEIFEYTDEDTAYNLQRGMRMAFGDQISWSYIRVQLA